MRKLVTVSAGILALTVLAWSGMPAGKVMAQLAAKKPVNCFGEYLSCVADAAQALFCCADPKAKACQPVALRAPQAKSLLEQVSCKAQFRDDLNSCEDAFLLCVNPSPAAK